jgi:[acyl-carrier-protein] S-malonyltransferase
MTVAVVFPGQGSQFAGMADPWAEHPAGRAVLDRASDVLGWDVVERSRSSEALELTEVVQPAVFACDLAAYAVLRAGGLGVDVAAGHSLGEYAALVAADAVELEPGLGALAARAAAMGDASRANPGAMTALIGMSPEDAYSVCDVAGRSATAGPSGARAGSPSRSRSTTSSTPPWARPTPTASTTWPPMPAG